MYNEIEQLNKKLGISISDLIRMGIKKIIDENKT